RARIVERAVPADRDDRQAQSCGHGDRLERVEPAHARAPHEYARPHRARVLHDLDLAVLAVGDDVLDVHLAVGNELGRGMHHAVVRTDRIGGHDVDIGEADRFGDGLASGRELLGLDVGGLDALDCDSHQSSPPAEVVGFAAGLAFVAAVDARATAFGSAGTPLIFSNHWLARTVLLPEIPLVGVVVELQLVDHDDAVLDRADLGADPAA